MAPISEQGECRLRPGTSRSGQADDRPLLPVRPPRAGVAAAPPPVQHSGQARQRSTDSEMPSGSSPAPVTAPLTRQEGQMVVVPSEPRAQPRSSAERLSLEDRARGWGTWRRPRGPVITHSWQEGPFLRLLSEF